MTKERFIADQDLDFTRRRVRKLREEEMKLARATHKLQADARRISAIRAATEEYENKLKKLRKSVDQQNDQFRETVRKMKEDHQHSTVHARKVMMGTRKETAEEMRKSTEALQKQLESAQALENKHKSQLHDAIRNMESEAKVRGQSFRQRRASSARCGRDEQLADREIEAKQKETAKLLLEEAMLMKVLLNAKQKHRKSVAELAKVLHDTPKESHELPEA